MNELELIKSMDFFSGLNEEQIEAVRKICYKRNIPQGTVVFRENTPAEHLYLIAHGQVKISHLLDNKLGEEELVILDEGECFGEVAMIDQGLRSATAVAEVDTLLLVIGKPDFDALIDRDKEIAIKILRKFCNILTNRLRETNKQISEMTGLFMSFRQKKK